MADWASQKTDVGEHRWIDLFFGSGKDLLGPGPNCGIHRTTNPLRKMAPVARALLLAARVWVSFLEGCPCRVCSRIAGQSQVLARRGLGRREALLLAKLGQLVGQGRMASLRPGQSVKYYECVTSSERREMARIDGDVRCHTAMLNGQLGRGRGFG